MNKRSAVLKRITRRDTKTARTSHYVCFECRKQFKKPSVAQFDVTAWAKPRTVVSGVDDDNFMYSCPQCGKPLQLIGKNFRAPKIDDLEAWKVAEILLHAGFSHGFASGTRYPTTTEEAWQFVKFHQASQGQKLLEQWRIK